MASGKPLQPIIIKRVKKAGHGAHGGAWKIAYADFVTAMMAFFLLMWLLGSTAKGQLDGIAEYFQSPLKVTLMGGEGTGNSDSILPGGGRDLSKTSGQVDGGDQDRGRRVVGAQIAKAEALKKEKAELDLLKERIRNLINTNEKLKEFKNQIIMDITHDGLHIQIVDEQNRPMFDMGRAVVKPYMRDILRELGATLKDVSNPVALAGHTDANVYGSGVTGYSNWELSADRANASRRELVLAGYPDDKLKRVMGVADTMPLLLEDPKAPINRRISIIVLNQAAQDRLKASFEKVEATQEGNEIQLPKLPNLPRVVAPVNGQ